MENVLNYIKYGVAILGTWLTWLFGTWDTAIGILVLFIVLDYLTGVVRGFVNKELSSDVGLKGIARKAVIFIVLIIAVALDRLMNTGSWVFRTLVCYFYIANEGLSLIERIGSFRLTYPRKIERCISTIKGWRKERN